MLLRRVGVERGLASIRAEGATSRPSGVTESAGFLAFLLEHQGVGLRHQVTHVGVPGGVEGDFAVAEVDAVATFCLLVEFIDVGVQAFDCVLKFPLPRCVVNPSQRATRKLSWLPTAWYDIVWSAVCGISKTLLGSQTEQSRIME